MERPKRFNMFLPPLLDSTWLWRQAREKRNNQMDVSSVRLLAVVVVLLEEKCLTELGIILIENDLIRVRRRLYLNCSTDTRDEALAP